MQNPGSLRRLLHPAAITFVIVTLLNGIFLAQAGWNPLALIQVGTRYGQNDPAGSEGYDGQFAYFIATDPRPAAVAAHLDVPAYRYQRILLPLTARILSLGSERIIPWALLALGVIAHTVGTWAIAELLAAWGVNRWYALTYGLWIGFLLAARLALPEPLSLGCVALALLALERGKPKTAWALFGLALFAKETAVIFVAAQALALIFRKDWKSAAGLGLIAGLPWAIFQGWLWQTFGQIGLASGGAMATPFEIIPFMGLWRIGGYSQTMLLVWVVVFGPTTVAPAVWGLWVSVRSLIRRETGALILAVLLNALTIVSLPFSTFREPAGLLRFFSSFLLAGLLFAARYRQRRALNYLSILWLAMNVFLLKG